jgi:teichuronic acid biosynthesis glycosyltransferase TuaH
MDIGLVPYTPSPFNRGSFPLKTLEYLAAGRPVAATDLPALRALGTDLIHITRQATFADLVDHLLNQPRTPQLAARCRAFAAQHTWARRAADIHHALTSFPPPAAATRPAQMAAAPGPP